MFAFAALTVSAQLAVSVISDCLIDGLFLLNMLLSLFKMIEAIVPENGSLNKVSINSLMHNLGKDEAVIYCFNYVEFADQQAAHRASLSEFERKRADDFVFPEHRAQYITAHGVLRALLSYYTGLAPDALCFDATEKGKPQLANKLADNWQFNLSHTGNCAAVAITRDHAIGVDVEQIKQDKELLALADRFYAPSEASMLKTRPENEQSKGFYALWTAKEAVLKATGQGIANGLDQWVFSLDAADSAVLEYAPESENDSKWSFFKHPLPSYQSWLAAAVDNPHVSWKLTFLAATA